MGNDEAALKQSDGTLHKPISTRKEGKWESNVFAGPQANKVNRKVLGKEGVGIGGLYGD